MNEVYEKLIKCYKQIRKITDFQASVGLVLGSGLGQFGECINVKYTVEYSSIEGFPVSTVSGHAGRFLFGHIKNVPVVCMQGRVHYYEGYKMSDVVLPIRLMCMLGAKKIILTNAAGGINPDFTPGTLMALTDHISSFVPSCLIGENADELGVRFPDMTCVYSKELLRLLKKTAKECDINLREGVYIQYTGPAYETPAEIRLAKILGADAVGMSTAVEAVAARHMGVDVCAVSCISNMAAGLNDAPLTHEEVKKTADLTADKFQKLIYNYILALGKDIPDTKDTQRTPEIQDTPGIQDINPKNSHVDIYTDGACKGNPGPGGFAYVLIGGTGEKIINKGFFNTTNNRMELLAAICALESLRYRCSVTLYSDSKYLIDGMNKGWAKSWKNNNWKKSDGKKALNTDLWERLLVMDKEHEIDYVWVKGHDGNKYNEMCDDLAVKAAENPTENDIIQE